MNVGRLWRSRSPRGDCLMAPARFGSARLSTSLPLADLTLATTTVSIGASDAAGPHFCSAVPDDNTAKCPVLDDTYSSHGSAPLNVPPCASQCGA